MKKSESKNKGLAPKTDYDYIITGPRLGLRKLSRAEISEKYLSWLNDPDVQKYSRRRGKVITRKEMEDFVDYASKSNDWHLAVIIIDEEKHIGNIAIDTIDKINKSGEISIMLGDKTTWNRGYGSEAIELATKFAFKNLDLHRLWAQSPNPAFNVLMKKLGWTLEGKRRKAFNLNLAGKFIDLDCWSILKNEWEGSRRLKTNSTQNNNNK